ncbi:MAG: cupin domain-containing protein [Pseudomonadota bacterium]|nr:cupin domain-containing protein [Pseudomonadota bacterium]
MAKVAVSDKVTALHEAGNLEDLYAALEPLDMTPGWIDRENPILWEQPDTPFGVMHWRYDQCRAALDAAGRLINTELAERRNLVLRAPVKGNEIATTKTLVNAYQMILPGEQARTHRHAPHALRVIIESEGSFSVVNGEKHPMETGDIVLTPGWCWHGHGHDGDRPAYWLDGLDVPLTHLLEPMFFEEHPEGFAPVACVTPDSPYRFTWDSIQKRTEQANADPEGYFGRRVRLEADEMPTIGIYVDRLEAGQVTRKFRHTANVVYCPMSGSGTSKIGDEKISWAPGDTFSAPTWNWIEHQVEEDTILFAMTDEFVMKFSNYYRFEAAA